MARDRFSSAVLAAVSLCGAYVGLQGALNVGVLERRFGLGAWPLLVLVASGALLAARLALGGRGGRARTTTAVGFVVLVAWIVTYHAWLQPYDRIVVEATLGLACALFALLRAPALRARLRPPRWVLPLAASSASTFVLLELGLTLLDGVRPMALLTTTADDAALKVASQRLEPGSIRLGHHCNARGFYDDAFSPPGERAGPAIAFIGDSFVVGIVPHVFNLTSVLERRLAGVEVFNLGVPAVGPDAYAWLLEHEALPLRPDLVLIGIFVGNDLTDARPSRGLDGALRRVLDEERTLTHLALDRLLALRREGLERANRPPPTEVAGSGTDPERAAEAFPWVFDHRRETPSFSEEFYLELVRHRAEAVCRPRAGLLADFLAHLDRLLAASGEVPLGLVLFPAEFQVEDRLWEVAREALGRRDERFERTAAQAAITAWAATRDLPVLDLYPLLRAAAPLADGDRHLYHRRDTHLNARGNHLAGAAVTDFVRREFPTVVDDPPR